MGGGGGGGGVKNFMWPWSLLSQTERTGVTGQEGIDPSCFKLKRQLVQDGRELAPTILMFTLNNPSCAEWNGRDRVHTVVSPESQLLRRHRQCQLPALSTSQCQTFLPSCQHKIGAH